MRMRSWRVLAGVAALAIFATFAAAAAIRDGEPEQQIMLRRLTESQYRQTIADLFGADIQLPGRFEHEPRTDGLQAVATTIASYSAGGFEQYDLNARTIAAQVTDSRRRQQTIPCAPPAGSFDRACATSFLGQVGRSLFRRPLTADELELTVNLAANEARRQGDFYAGVAFALTSLLDSPNFLFRVERANRDAQGHYVLDAYSKASRLSFFLWNAPPDDHLLAAAAAGRLDNPNTRAKEVDRMMRSPRVVVGTRAFFSDLLGLDAFNKLSIDASIYPLWVGNTAVEAKEETLRLVIDHLVTRNEDYRDLFTTRRAFLTRGLGVIYHAPATEVVGWTPYEFPEEAGRAGILTRVGFLSVTSHPGATSPTLRGKAIRELLMCQVIPPPPDDVSFTIVQNTSDPVLKTARDRFRAHAESPTCAACHRLMDPLGLPLETFDGSGVARTTENGAPIVTTGQLGSRTFADATGLGQALHDDPQVPSCLVDRSYSYAVGRKVSAAEREPLTKIKASFAAGGYRYPDLLRQIANSDAFYRAPQADGQVPAAPNKGSNP